MKTFAAIAALGALAVAPAFADETWKTDFGQVIWEDDFDGGAIFLIKLDGGKAARFYIEGLTASDETRGNYKGYWINTAEADVCSAELTGPDGTKGTTWGRLSLTFVDPSFPSDWVMLLGDCMAEPDSPVTGKASTAG